MSEEAAKFRIYVSYVPDETPAALISWLSEWSRFSLDDEAISFSNPSATATELQAAVSNCQMVLHILTKNSFNFLHCQREMDSARLFQCPIIGIQTDDREPNAVQFDAVISSIGELRVFLRHILSLYTLFESAEDEAAWSVVLTAATTLLPQYPLVRGKLLLRFWEMQGLFNILVGRLRSLLAQTNVHPIAHSEIGRAHV